MRRIALLSVAVSGLFMAPAVGQTSSETSSADAGKKVYERANCVGCHKWSGGGGGGYGGAALSLRATQLSLDDIKEIVTCGRPGTGMPHFTTDPYRDGACYGLTAADVKDIMPPNANVVLRQEDIEEVAQYVVASIKGKGDPTFADCTAFFGSESRACEIYQPKTEGASSHHAMPTPATTSR